MDVLLSLITEYGLWFVFLAVLLDQGGLPLPAWPVLAVSSTVAVAAGSPLWPIVLVATVAALLADTLWYIGGRHFGARLIRLMCHLSLSPDSCVATTKGIYARWGTPSLMLCKFVPGFAAVGTTMAGLSHTPYGRFALFDGIGALLWSGVGIGLGAIFHNAIRDLLETLDSFGRWGLLAVAAAIVLFVGWKAARRQLLVRQMRMARVSVADLQQYLAQNRPLVLLDARPLELRARHGWIPGAVPVDQIEGLEFDAAVEVVVYCDCPNEISAALVARDLHRRGIRRARPLAGGLEAWRGHGLPVATSSDG